MSNPKLTPWFPGSVKPVRPGVYRTRTLFGDGYQKWDGKRWTFLRAEAFFAAMSNEVSVFQRPKWRGLASPPEVSK